MTAPVATLLLARHGETVWHEENRYAGVHSDVDLTDLGRRQAQALAEWAVERSPSAVVSSPVRRAVETATPAAQALGLDLDVVDDLREVSFGVAEGRTVHELQAQDPELVRRFRADPVAHAFPGSEPPDAAGRRGAAALRSLATTHAGRTVLVVAHNTLLRLALCELVGIPMADYRRVLPRLDNVAVTTLRLREEGPAGLVSLNVPLTPRPGPTGPPTTIEGAHR